MVRILCRYISVKAIGLNEEMAHIDTAVDLLSAVRHKADVSIISGVSRSLIQHIFLHRHFANAITLIAQLGFHLGRKREVHSQVHGMTLSSGVGSEEDELVVDIHEAGILQATHDSGSFFVEHSQVEGHPFVEQRGSRVAFYFLAHGFVVKLTIDVDHIGTLTRMHGVTQVHALVFQRGIHRHGRLQIAFGTKSRGEGGLRILHQSWIIDHRSFTDTVHHAIEQPLFVGARQAIDAQRHFGSADPTRIGFLAHIASIVGRQHFGLLAVQMYAGKQISTFWHKACGGTRR